MVDFSFRYLEHLRDYLQALAKEKLVVLYNIHCLSDNHGCQLIVPTVFIFNWKSITLLFTSSSYSVNAQYSAAISHAGPNPDRADPEAEVLHRSRSQYFFPAPWRHHAVCCMENLSSMGRSGFESTDLKM